LLDQNLSIAQTNEYAAEWGGLVWVLPPGNQTEAGLVSVWVFPVSVRSGLDFSGSDPVH
jgi:hypothetical protein